MAVVERAIRPTIAFPPVDAAAAQADRKPTSRAYAAALIGVLRGELWADYAFALASVPIREFEDAKTIAAPRSIEPARSAARRAAELSPHIRGFGCCSPRSDSQNEQFRSNVSEELKTPYYTGPNEDALRPLRIRVRAGVRRDSGPGIAIPGDLEIQTIIAHAPALKPSIIAAYLHGSAAGRRFLEDEAPKLDPELLDVLHKADQAQIEARPAAIAFDVPLQLVGRTRYQERAVSGGHGAAACRGTLTRIARIAVKPLRP